jgi:hypothetical protein
MKSIRQTHVKEEKKKHIVRNSHNGDTTQYCICHVDGGPIFGQSRMGALESRQANFQVSVKNTEA